MDKHRLYYSYKAKKYIPLSIKLLFCKLFSKTKNRLATEVEIFYLLDELTLFGIPIHEYIISKRI